MKILFLPFSIAGGILAGLIAKKAFDMAWRLVDDEEAPEPEHRGISWPKRDLGFNAAMSAPLAVVAEDTG